MIPLRLALRLLLSIVCVLLAGCASIEPEWVSGQTSAASDRVLWEVTRIALESQHFHVLTDGFDPITHTAQSAWQMDLHPFRGEGFRERVHVTYQAAGPGRVELSVRVEHEINNNIAKPTDPNYADWKKDVDNPARAKVILQQIQSRLGSPRENSGRG